MQTYIGTKIVNAELWEKGGQAGYRIAYPDGYVSWSPKAVFEEAYRLVNDDERRMVEGRKSAADEQRTTARQSDRPNEEITEGVRMTGGDQSEEPIPFTG